MIPAAEGLRAMGEDTVTINRAPVLTPWAAVVAECLGYDTPAALTLGKALSGLNAQRKGRMLGIFGKPAESEGDDPPKKAGLGEEACVELCGRSVPVRHTAQGLRAVVKDQPLDPESVAKHLTTRFGEALPAVREAMRELAASLPPEHLAERSYDLHEQFRPKIEPGQRGWGQAGELSLTLIRSLAATKPC